jgi:hypothetical protein
MYSPTLIVSIISLRNFTYKNKNGGHFSLVASQNLSQGPIYNVALEAEMYTDLREPDDIRPLFQVFVIYVKDRSYCSREHYGTAISFA